MLAALGLWAGLAMALEPADLPARGDEPLRVWIGPKAEALDGQKLQHRDGCELVSLGPLLPEGLTVLAERHSTDGCGDVAYIRLPFRADSPLSKWAFVEPRFLTAEPPKGSPWGRAKAVRVAYVRMVNFQGGPMAIDEVPERPFPVFEGERVEVLSEVPLVVRTVGGRVLATSSFTLVDTDPLTRSKAKARAAKDRLATGRDARGGVRWVPKAEELLLKSWQGRVVDIEWRSFAVAHNVFAEGWLDPVAQVIEQCPGRWDQRSDPIACGAYFLDYSAFGAWWPPRSDQVARVLAVVKGHKVVDGRKLPVLEVMVKDPWESWPKVAPAWTD